MTWAVATWSKTTLRASAQTYAPTEVVFFDQRGQAVKRITFSEYVPAGPRQFPTRVVVEDLLRQGNRTVARYSEVQFGIPIPPACFTLQALESGC